MPLSITLESKSYQLSAAMLFKPPEVAGIGHYTAAIRFNKTWEIFDDLRENIYSISADIPVTIHSVLYTVLEN